MVILPPCPCFPVFPGHAGLGLTLQALTIASSALCLSHMLSKECFKSKHCLAASCCHRCLASPTPSLLALSFKLEYLTLTFKDIAVAACIPSSPKLTRLWSQGIHPGAQPSPLWGPSLLGPWSLSRRLEAGLLCFPTNSEPRGRLIL